MKWSCKLGWEEARGTVSHGVGSYVWGRLDSLMYSDFF